MHLEIKIKQKTCTWFGKKKFKNSLTQSNLLCPI